MSSTSESLHMDVVAPSPGHEHTATVIIAKGLWATSHDWTPMANRSREEPGLSHIKWILPHEGNRWRSEQNKMFNIQNSEFTPGADGHNEQDLFDSVHALREILLAEIHAGTPPDRIVLGGFSQGGAVALFTGFTSQHTLAGVVVTSGWVPALGSLESMATENARRLPVFWGHGRSDPLVKWESARQSLEWMKAVLNTKSAPENVSGDSSDQIRGVHFCLHDGLAHSVSQTEERQIGRWLEHVVPSGL